MTAVESEGGRLRHAPVHLKGQKIMVEFVSANPTGPMHMGNARGGVLGDTLASVLDRCGLRRDWREFYVNDAGNQIDKFAKSIEARYLQIIQGEDAVALPGGRLPRRRHPGAGPGRIYDQHGDELPGHAEPRSATPPWRAVRPDREHRPR